jgi:hypothetical protein
MPGEPYNPSPVGNPSVLARRNWFQTALVKFIGKHTPKCREMVRILSQSMDQPMPLMMRIKKRIHFLICCWCQRYEEQLHYMRKAARAFAEHADEASIAAVPEETKERWKEVVGASAYVVQDWSEKKDVAVRKFPRPRMTWFPGILLAGAAVVAVAFLFMWTNVARPGASLADYRDEMLSFARVDPTLEMQSTQLSDLVNWLETSHGMSGVLIPAKVKTMEPVGCRVLRFRQHDVGLICFRRTNGKLLHLFVIDRIAFPHLPSKDRPEFSSHGEWMTAAWIDGEHAYLLAVQGDQTQMESFLKL